MANYPDGATLKGCIPAIESAELVQMGGQKAVYRATIQGQVVALKVLSLSAETDAEEDDGDVSAVVDRARRELAILEQADLDVLTKRGPLDLTALKIDGEDWLYFTEEWIEGKSLAEMIREKPLTPSQVARLGVDLIRAVSWLAQRDHVHRDIKPANVMWSTERSRFVLLDHGIALDLNAPSITSSNFIVGTRAYLSPEQMDLDRKRNLDFRSDLFAIGVVMYEAATGAHPFSPLTSGTSDVEYAIRNVAPIPLSSKLDNFPQSLSDLVNRLLGKAPHLRYRTSTLASEAIKEIAISLGVAP